MSDVSNRRFSGASETSSSSSSIETAGETDLNLVSSIREYTLCQDLTVNSIDDIIEHLGRDVLGDKYDELKACMRALFRNNLGIKDAVNDCFSARFGAAVMDMIEQQARRTNGLEDEDESSRLSLEDGASRQLFQSNTKRGRNSNDSLEEETDDQLRKRVRLASEDEDEESDDGQQEQQQRLADQREHDRIEREKEVARVQQQEAEEQRRLQQEKEELEQQELAVKEAKVKVALHIQCRYRGLVARNEAAKAKELRLAAAKAEGAVTIQCLFRASIARIKAKTLRVKKAAAAAHQQRLKERRERDRLSRARKKKSEMVKKCSDILQRCIKMKNDESSTYELGAKINLIDMLSDMIDTTFDGQNNLKLDEIIKNVVTLVGPSIKYNSIVSTSLSSKANKMAATFANGNVSLGELLDSCDSKLDTVDQTMDEDIIRLKKIVYQHNNPGVQMADITEVEYEKVGPTALSNFVKLSNPMSHMLQHLLNLSVISSMFEDLKLSDLAAHQPQKDAAALLSGASELAQLVNPNVPFDDNMTIMSIILRYVFPGFDEDNAWILAAKTLISICDGMTNVGSTPEQVKAYKTHILPLIRTKQSNSLSGERVEGGVDFFGGSGTTYNNRRRRAARTFLMVGLKKAMLRICPNGLFDSSGGYTRSILRLSPSYMYSKFTFVNHGLIEEEHLGEDCDEVGKIKTDVLNKQKPNDGEKILVFDSSNDEQLGSMKFLLTAWSHIPPK